MRSHYNSNMFIAICSYSGVCVDGQELYTGKCCHVRGGQGKDAEYTCEIAKLYEDINGEMVAEVRWFYWPAELHTKRKLKNLPSFSSKEILLSDEYDRINVESLSKPCHVITLPSTARPPEKASKGTYYCRWQICKESREVLPAIQVVPTTAEGVGKQIENHRKNKIEAASPKSPLIIRKRRDERRKKEDETASQKKQRTSPSVTTKPVKNKHKVTSKRQTAQPVNKGEDKELFQVARER